MGMRNEVRTRQVVVDPQTSPYRTRRGAVRLLRLIAPALLGGIALALLSGLTGRAMPVSPRTRPPRVGNVGASPVLTAPLPSPLLLNVQVSSAYTTAGKLYDGTLL